MTIIGASATSQAVLLLYLQAIEWIDMFPWNDIRRGNGQETLDVIIGVIMVGAIVSAARRWRIGTAVGLVFYLVWMTLQITTFWIPYVQGASPRWARIHAAHFAKTVQWLPTWDNHLPPDASHFVLQLLLLVTIVLTALALRRIWRR